MSGISEIKSIKASLYARPPQVKTSRLALRILDMGDAESIFGICRDPRTVRFVSLERQNSIDDAQELLQTFGRMRKNKHGLAWGIVLRKTKQLIGIITITQMNKLVEAELGFVVSRDHWGHGYAAEAAKALVTFGFDRLRLDRVYARCRLDNPQSARAIEKVGLKFRRLQPKKISIKGKIRDLRLYSLTRRDHDATKCR